MTVTVVRGYASPVANQGRATGTPTSNQQLEANQTGVGAAASVNQQAIRASNVTTQRIVSEAAVSSVRATRGTTSPDKIRDADTARAVAEYVAEKIVTEGRDSAHTLDPHRAQPHIG